MGLRAVNKLPDTSSIQISAEMVIPAAHTKELETTKKGIAKILIMIKKGIGRKQKYFLR